MFWWFQRKGDFLRVEVLQLATENYELRVIDSSGVEHVETFTNADDLAKRQTQLQDEMFREGWTGPHGWVI